MQAYLEWDTERHGRASLDADGLHLIARLDEDGIVWPIGWLEAGLAQVDDLRRERLLDLHNQRGKKE